MMPSLAAYVRHAEAYGGLWARWGDGVGSADELSTEAPQLRQRSRHVRARVRDGRQRDRRKALPHQLDQADQPEGAQEAQGRHRQSWSSRPAGSRRCRWAVRAGGRHGTERVSGGSWAGSSFREDHARGTRDDRTRRPGRRVRAVLERRYVRESGPVDRRVDCRGGRVCTRWARRVHRWPWLHDQIRSGPPGTRHQHEQHEQLDRNVLDRRPLDRSFGGGPTTSAAPLGLTAAAAGRRLLATYQSGAAPCNRPTP